MYQVCAEGTSVSVDVKVPPLAGSAAPSLDVAAVRGKDKTLNLLVVNREPERAIPCRMKLKGFSAKQSTGQILTGKSLNSYNDFDQPNNVASSDIELNVEGESFTYTFAPHSVTLMQIN
jgi:alpha-N-arabinofuranosidase